ncbi:inner membrane protein YhjD [Mycobacterium botniense]
MRARYGWFDHVLRANERFNAGNGNFLAAGLTYYTIFALFPLLMVGFAVVGFMLSRRPDLLTRIDGRIRASVSGELGQQLIGLMNAAIDSRTSVGAVGLATAAWAGLSWMANLREALSCMWKCQARPAGLARTKLSDLAAMLSAFLVTVAAIALTTLGDATVMARMLRWVGIHDLPGLGVILRGVSLLMSVLVSWLLSTWMIARLPRARVSLAISVRAGLLAAVGFGLFAQIASVYLRAVLRTPAGATFGPVLGVMVFAYITARLILFAAAWAATLAESAAVPDPRGAGNSCGTGSFPAGPAA